MLLIKLSLFPFFCFCPNMNWQSLFRFTVDMKCSGFVFCIMNGMCELENKIGTVLKKIKEVSLFFLNLNLLMFDFLCSNIVLFLWIKKNEISVLEQLTLFPFCIWSHNYDWWSLGGENWSKGQKYQKLLYFQGLIETLIAPTNLKA